MTPNIKIPQPDQTLESLACVSWLANSGKSLDDFFRDLCSTTTWRRKGRSPVASLSPALTFSYLNGAGYSSVDELLSTHTYLPLFRPFADPTIYATVRENFTSRHRDISGNLFHISRKDVVHAQTQYCPVCVDSDIRNLGFAYARRSHQVLGVLYCHLHGHPLRSPSERLSGAHAQCGVLLTTSELGDEQARFIEAASTQERLFQQRFALFVAAALDGQLPAVSPSQRKDLISKYLINTPQLKGDARSLPHRFEQSVRRLAQPEWLREMNLDPSQRANCRWPASFVGGIAYQEDPIVALLVNSLMFDSPSDYYQAIKSRAIAENHIESFCDEGIERGRPEVPLTGTLLRHLLNKDSLGAIARRTGLTRGAVAAIIRTYPSLETHRSRPKRTRTARERFLQCCKDLLELYLEKPTAQRTREALRSALGDVYLCIEAEDPNFLDQVLPTPFAIPAGRSEAAQVMSEGELKAALQYAAEQFRSEVPYGPATTRSIVRRLSSQAREALLRYPASKSKALLRDVVEPPAEYCQRLTNLLATVVSRGNADLARDVGDAFLLHRYSRGYEDQVNALLSGIAFSSAFNAGTAPPDVLGQMEFSRAVA